MPVKWLMRRSWARTSSNQKTEITPTRYSQSKCWCYYVSECFNFESSSSRWNAIYLKAWTKKSLNPVILWWWKNLHPLIVLSLCCSNSSLPLSFGRFDSEIYPLFLINENFHLAKKKKKKEKKRRRNPIKDFANNFFMHM